MNKMILAITLLAMGGVSVNAFSSSHKTDVCHKGRDVSVAMSSVDAHMNHGDTMGDCDEAPSEPESEADAAVLMMRCEAQAELGFVVVSASSSPVLDLVVPGEDCATAMADKLNDGFELESINSGSAGMEGDLHFYTDYLLIGEVPEDS